MKDVYEEIKSKINYVECREDFDDNSATFELDRFSRHDHGGGEDGNDWLDDDAIEEDRQKGIKKHQSKLDAVNTILKKAGFKPNAEFELGEKGHFSIEIWFQEP